jgi:hypothetical protein
MIKKYNSYLSLIKEETGMRNITKIIDDHKKNHGNNFEIWFHQDLDGITSALSMKNYLERYGMKMVDSHITQYGTMEYAIKNKKPDSLAALVDFAHFKTMFSIATDHHTDQTGEPSGSYYAKPSRSNVETISGEISPSDIFTHGDIELVKTVDSADFLKHNIRPEDIQNAIFKMDKALSGEKNRFMMGFVVNRLILVFKNKRITVKSLDGKRNHVNKNFLECLVLDSSPSLVSIFMNIKHYMNSAMSLEWDRQKRQHNVPKKLTTPEQIAANLEKYIKSRKEGGEVDFDTEYNIVKQYGIGSVYDTGSYDRYVIFKNNPAADFVCTIFPMGLIQVSCNPFKEKILKQINLGAITTEVLAKYKYQLSNINVPISDIKRISEDEIDKMKNKYGPDYEAIGFTFGDLKAFYPKAINYLPNRKNNDMKTKVTLDLNSDNPMVKIVEDCMSKPFSEWSYKEKDEMSWLRISAMTIIEVNSGGHPSITNIQGLNYLGSRRDLLKRLFNTEDYTDVMKLFADEFIDNLKGKIDDVKMGKNVEYQKTGVELHGDVFNESFDYYLKTDNGNVKPVTKDEFIKAGFDSKFEPKRPDNGNKGFSIDIEDKRIIGKFN